MKTTLINKRAGVAIAALVTSIGLSTSAKAIVLVYEDGPLVGQAFSGAGVKIKFTNFDTGSVYNTNPALGGAATAGYSGASTTPVEKANLQANGIAALDALQAFAPTAPSMVQTFINGMPQGFVAPEDVWGIARITTINDVNGFTLWTPQGKNDQLTVLISGIKDFYYTSDATSVTADGVGLRLDFFEAPIFPNTFNPLLGPALGHGGNTVGAGSVYPTVTTGAPILTFRSVANFINPAGVRGGLATEFESNINTTTNGGTGSNGFSFLDVVGGTDMAQFDTSAIESTLVPGLFTDISIQFTETSFGLNPDGSPKTQNGWLVRSDDPVTANIAVPEPTTVLAGLGCVLPILGSVLGRRRKK